MHVRNVEHIIIQAKKTFDFICNVLKELCRLHGCLKKIDGWLSMDTLPAYVYMYVTTYTGRERLVD